MIVNLARRWWLVSKRKKDYIFKSVCSVFFFALPVNKSAVIACQKIF